MLWILKLWLKFLKKRKEASTSEATAGHWYHYTSAQKVTLKKHKKILAFHISAQIYQINLL